jgi:tripartite-type tricarboxylate transporter receptor subunit TctC
MLIGIRHLLVLLALSSVGLGSAYAQGYPSKPTHIVVPYPPGGSVDALARLLAPMLASSLGQPVIVENRPGANANIGANYVAKAAPDGYTLLMSAATSLAASVSIFKQLPYDPRRSFAPIVLTTYQPNVLVVHPSVQAKSIEELIAMAKTNPGKLNYAIAAMGGPQHMSGELFMMMTGAKLTQVPYKGGGPAVNDLLAGHVEMMFGAVPEVIQFVRAGKLRPLAVTTSQRSSLLPDVPSMHEAGLTGYSLVGWHGLAAPAGTPKDVIAKLNAAVNQALMNKDLRKRLADMGLDSVGGTPEEFQAFITEEIDKYAKLVKASGMQPE